ncbi:hypothetical protein BN168_380014 [Clostridioides difficile CD002]|nr:hypothetical protein BN168_380014 [Clostridioides difficile CD002]
MFTFDCASIQSIKIDVVYIYNCKKNSLLSIRIRILSDMLLSQVCFK